MMIRQVRHHTVIQYAISDIAMQTQKSYRTTMCRRVAFSQLYVAYRFKAICFFVTV